MKDIERCSCGMDMVFQHGDIRINFNANKQRLHQLDTGGLYIGHYSCHNCGKLWITTTLKRFRRSHVLDLF